VVFKDFIYIVNGIITKELVLDIINVLIKLIGVKEVIITRIIFMFIFINIKV
jgi:hypothetical protein